MTFSLCGIDGALAPLKNLQSGVEWIAGGKKWIKMGKNRITGDNGKH